MTQTHFDTSGQRKEENAEFYSSDIDAGTCSAQKRGGPAM